MSLWNLLLIAYPLVSICVVATVGVLAWRDDRAVRDDIAAINASFDRMFAALRADDCKRAVEG